MDPKALQHLAPGDPFPTSADVVNRWNAAARYTERPQNQTTDGSRRLVDPCMVRVTNRTGTALAQFSAVQLKLTALDASRIQRGHLVFGAYAPAAPLIVCRRLAIIQQPLASGRVGIAQVSGVTPALIDLQSEQSISLQFARPTTDCRLTDDLAGPCEILYRPDEVGESKTAIVCIGPPVYPVIQARTLAAINAAAWSGSPNPCNGFSWTSGTGHFYDGDTTLTPAYYDVAQTEAIELTLVNINTLSVDTDKLVNVELDHRGRWVIDIESCHGGDCSDGYA